MPSGMSRCPVVWKDPNRRALSDPAAAEGGEIRGAGQQIPPAGQPRARLSREACLSPAAATSKGLLFRSHSHYVCAAP